MYCSTCGKEIEDGSLFCNHCGAPQHKKKRSKKALLLLVLTLALLAAALVGGKLYLDAATAPEKTIESFLSAMREEDAAALGKVSVVNENEFALNEARLKPFFEAYSHDPEVLSDFEATLARDLETLRAGGTPAGGRFVRLAIRESNPLYTTYVVELFPVTVTFYCEFDGTQLALAGDTLEIGLEERDCRLLPGCYSGTARYISPETGAMLETAVEDYTFDADGDYFRVFFDYTSMWLEGYNSALALKRITIDGKPYQGDLSNLSFYNGFYIYPVPSDGIVTVTASAFGVDFEETFDLAENTSCRFRDYRLPDALEAEAKRIGADVIARWLEITMTYSSEARDALAAAYPSSEAFVSAVSLWLDGCVGNASEETVCRRYVGTPAASEVQLELTIDADGIGVTAEQTLRGSVQPFRYWSEEESGAAYDELTTCRAALRYRDGTWSVLTVGEAE